MFIDSIQGVHVPMPQIKNKPDSTVVSIRKLLGDLDANNDGFLTLDEVRYSDQIHDDIDDNKDGLVTIKEYITSVLKSNTNTPDKITVQQAEPLAETVISALLKKLDNESEIQTEDITHQLFQEETLNNPNNPLLENLKYDPDLSVVA